MVNQLRNGKTKTIPKIVPMWVGIVSPYGDPLIMFTRSPNETILHTEYDILMVTDILHKRGIKHKVMRVENTHKNFSTILN